LVGPRQALSVNRVPFQSDIGFSLLQVTKTDMENKAKEYWKRNLRLLVILLSVWFIVSFGFGILLVDQLDAIRIGGFKLGFWFAQQGSQYVFIILIFIYIYKMNKLDKEFDFDEG
jgi:putative solute:sodium symporter small subunit